MRFVQEHLNIPTADIVAYDCVGDNPIDSPYILQDKIAGHDLGSKAQSYPSLTHEQKLRFVREFCHIIKGTQALQSPWTGRLCQNEEELTINPFEIPSDKSQPSYRYRSSMFPFFSAHSFGDNSECNEQSILHFLEMQFARWRVGHIGLNPMDVFESTIWEKLLTVVREMDAKGCLFTEYVSLTHYDLDPRNIMVDIQPSGLPKITGIIDWDLACFAPDWVSCKPPMWIWEWLDGGSEDESKANDEPPTKEGQQLKKLFDELMGEDYTFAAYTPHCRIARDMFRFARFGLPSVELMEQAEKIPERWEECKVWWEQKQKDETEKKEAEDAGAVSDVEEGSEGTEGEISTRSVSRF